MGSRPLHGSRHSFGFKPSGHHRPNRSWVGHNNMQGPNLARLSAGRQPAVTGFSTRHRCARPHETPRHGVQLTVPFIALHPVRDGCRPGCGYASLLPSHVTCPTRSRCAYAIATRVSELEQRVGKAGAVGFEPQPAAYLALRGISPPSRPSRIDSHPALVRFRCIERNK